MKALGGEPRHHPLGETYFTAVLWSDASPPVPSLADAGYLSLPPLVFAVTVQGPPTPLIFSTLPLSEHGPAAVSAR